MLTTPPAMRAAQCRLSPTLADIDDAIAEVLPPAMQAPCKPRAEALQTPGKPRGARPAAHTDFQPAKPRQTNFEPTPEEHVSPALAG